MENNFGLILLDLVGKNKDKFLGLLRRNGVLVGTNVSNEDLTNMILKAMQKSESFKKETIMLMGVLASSDKNFSNYTGSFSDLPTFSTSLFGDDKKTTTSTTATDKPKKDFKDTTVGGIVDKLFTLGNKYLENKALDVRTVEAKQTTQQKEKELEIEKTKKDNEKGNTGLYVALGVGGVALIGTLIYVVSKKK